MIPSYPLNCFGVNGVLPSKVMAQDVWHFFQYCPRCGARLSLQMNNGDPSLLCPQDGFVFYQNPHAAVSAVIVNDRRQVLMVRRRQEPARGMWDFPGGFVTWGKDPRQAVKREVREELGIVFRPHRVLNAYHDWYDFQGLRYSVNAVYFLGASSGRLSPNDEVGEPTWFDIDRLTTEFSFDSVRQAVRDIPVAL